MSVEHKRPSEQEKVLSPYEELAKALANEGRGSIKIQAFRDQALLQLAVGKVNTAIKDNMLDHLHGVSTTEIQRYFDERRYIPAALVRAVASQVVIEERIQERLFFTSKINIQNR